MDLDFSTNCHIGLYIPAILRVCKPQWKDFLAHPVRFSQLFRRLSTWRHSPFKNVCLEDKKLEGQSPELEMRLCVNVLSVAHRQPTLNRDKHGKWFEAGVRVGDNFYRSNGPLLQLRHHQCCRPRPHIRQSQTQDVRNPSSTQRGLYLLPTLHLVLH